MIHEDDPWIERRIVTGMIVSVDYLREIRPLYNARLLGGTSVSMLADWCLKHFDKYQTAPGRDIQVIYDANLRNGLNKDDAESIESILRSLSDEYERGQFNVPHLVDQTRNYFQEKNLRNYSDDIRGELLAGNLSEAEKLASNYKPVAKSTPSAIDPFADAERIRRAFADPQRPLIRFSKTLGEFWNDQLIRDSFVALMGPEKRGKSFWLMEFAMRAMMCGCNVAFFQAGDMSELQMIKRLCIYLAKRNDKAKYCEGIYLPVVDCLDNQFGLCNRKERESTVSVFSPNDALKDINHEKLVAASSAKKNKDYRACRNCKHVRNTVWLVQQPVVEPLDWKSAWRKIKLWQRRHKKRFRLSTHANEMLTVAEIKTLLDTWERQENFVADVVVVDYADILAPDLDCIRLDYRNQQNKIWQRLRRLSQQKHCLVLTATQASARSYNVERNLRLSDFSETKTKYAHVTAMYGLNQSNEEKKIGIMKINELVVREGDFDTTNQVKILQRLQIGKPYLGSFK